MRVVHYLTNLTSSGGGVFYAASRLAKAQAVQGADVTAIGGTDERFADEQEAWGGVCVRPFPLRGRYGLHPRPFIDFMSVGRPIFHVHGVWSAGSLYARQAAALGCPVVVSPHGMLDPWIVARRRRIKAVHAALLERPLLRRSHVHVLCDAERQVVTAYEPAAEGRTFVIPNGIDLGEAAPVAKRSGTLFLGRLHPKKQVLELVRRWKAMPGLGSEALTVAGWGDVDYEREVQSEIAGAANIRWAGRLHGIEKAQAQASARFFILPSLSEGLPVAVLEALQAGCIPVITGECNLPELFAANVALRIRSDFADFPAVMPQALAIPQEAAEGMAARGQDFARRYAIDKVARAMLDRYAAILAGRATDG